MVSPFEAMDEQGVQLSTASRRRLSAFGFHGSQDGRVVE